MLLLALPCITESGPDSNSTCQFPFQFDGLTWTSCTTQGNSYEDRNKTWCSTKVDESGKHVTDKWGWCNENCSLSVKAGESILNKKVIEIHH